MKHVISITLMSFVLISCSGSGSGPSDSPSPEVVVPHGDPVFDKVATEFLAGEILARYKNWQDIKKSIQGKPEDGESYNLANEFLLGNYLRSLSEDPAALMIVREDFKSRHGRQSKEDFLALAKKIYKRK